MDNIFDEKSILQAMLDNTETQIVYLDHNFNFFKVNSAFTEASGYTTNALVGKNYFDMFPNAESRTIFEKVRASSQPAIFRDQAYVFAYQPERGVTYWDWTITPVKDKSGSVQGLVLSLMDRTGRKRAEEALRKLNDELETMVSQRTNALLKTNKNLKSEIRTREGVEETLSKSVIQFRNLVDTAPIGIAIVAKDGRILFENTAITQMSGYRKDDVPNILAEEIYVFPEDKKLVSEFLKLGEPVKDLEVQFKRKDGTPYWVSVSAVPSLTEFGEAFIMTVTDITERKETNEELRTIPRRLFEAQEKERRSIARELHDQTGQYLTALKMLIGRIKSALGSDRAAPLVDEALSLSDETIQQVRDMSLNLRPPMIDSSGLLPALNWQFQRITAQTGLKIDLDQSGIEGNELSADINLTIFRIIQEALTNVLRYSGVNEATVTIKTIGDSIEFSVEDKGRGFDVEEAEEKASNGLINMRERAALLGGKCTIISAPGKGTTVSAELPVPK